MIPFIEAYLERLEWLHAEIMQAMQDLPTEALDWSPGTEMNSLAVLVTHLAGSERYWLGDVVAGEPSGRVRETEFHVHDLKFTALVERLKEADRYALHALGGLSQADLEEAHTNPRDGKQAPIAWYLLYAMNHTALHLGHIQVTRQLWESRAN